MRKSTEAARTGRAQGSRWQALREGTRAAHQAIESNPAMAVLLRDDCTLYHYTHTLAAILGWMAPLEQRLRRDAFRHPAPVATPGRYRTPRLLADLRALGQSEAWIQQLPWATELPDTTDSSQRLGVLYVIEGSSLGGTLITRTLRQRLGAAVDHALAYFDCYDGEAGRAWARFKESVDALDDAVIDIGKAVAGAKLCFHSLDQWLRSQCSDSAESARTEAGLARAGLKELLPAPL